MKQPGLKQYLSARKTILQKNESVRKYGDINHQQNENINNYKKTALKRKNGLFLKGNRRFLKHTCPLPLGVGLNGSRWYCDEN